MLLKLYFGFLILFTILNQINFMISKSINLIIFKFLKNFNHSLMIIIIILIFLFIIYQINYGYLNDFYKRLLFFLNILVSSINFKVVLKFLNLFFIWYLYINIPKFIIIILLDLGKSKLVNYYIIILKFNYLLIIKFIITKENDYYLLNHEFLNLFIK